MPTFTHGTQAKFYANGADLTPYVDQVDAPTSSDTAETTSLADKAKTYIPGLQDATLKTQGFFDRSAGASDAFFDSALGVQSSVITYLPAGDAVPSTGYAMSAQETTYQVDASVADAVKVSADFQSSVGGEYVASHHALAARSGAGTATVVDGGTATTTGAVGYLHACANGGTTTIKVQHSADNVTYADLLTFTGVTAGTAGQRIAQAGTVNQYTRLTYTPVGGTVTFWAGLGRNPEL